MLVHITHFSQLLDYSISQSSGIDFAFISASNGSLVATSSLYSFDKISKTMKADSFSSITSKLWMEFMVHYPSSQGDAHVASHIAGAGGIAAAGMPYSIAKMNSGDEFDDQYQNPYIAGGDQYQGQNFEEGAEFDTNIGSRDDMGYEIRSRSVSNEDGDNNNNDESNKMGNTDSNTQSNSSQASKKHQLQQHQFLLLELDEPKGIVAMTSTTNGRFLITLYSSSGKAPAELMRKRIGTIREAVDVILGKVMM